MKDRPGPSTDRAYRPFSDYPGFRAGSQYRTPASGRAEPVELSLRVLLLTDRDDFESPLTLFAQAVRRAPLGTGSVADYPDADVAVVDALHNLPASQSIVDTVRGVGYMAPDPPVLYPDVAVPASRAV